jgi:hypothetical protein
MTPRSAAISNFCYLPFHQGLYDLDSPELRLALYRIIYNPRTTVKFLL